MGVANERHSMQHTIWILKYTTIKAKCAFFIIFLGFVDQKLILSER